MGGEVGRGSGAVHRHVEQIADVRLKAGLLTQLPATSLAEAFTFLDPTTRKHTVGPTVFQSVDDEQARASNDDGR